MHCAQASSVFSEVLRDEDARASSAKATHAGSPRMGAEAGRFDAVPLSPANRAPANADASPAAGTPAAGAEPVPPSSSGLASLLDSPASSQVCGLPPAGRLPGLAMQYLPLQHATMSAASPPLRMHLTAMHGKPAGDPRNSMPGACACSSAGSITTVCAWLSPPVPATYR